MTLESELFLLLTAAFSGGITVAAAVFIILRILRRRRIKRRFKRGAEGEREALEYLRHHGFTVDAGQAELTAEMLVDRKVRPFTVRADYLGRKRGKRCVVEVKTGKQAVDPLCSDTRRQLLEYALWYDVDKVYLYNADDAELSEIGFPALMRRSRPNSIIPFVFGMFAGASAITLFVVYYFHH